MHHFSKKSDFGTHKAPGSIPDHYRTIFNESGHCECVWEQFRLPKLKARSKSVAQSPESPKSRISNLNGVSMHHFFQSYRNPGIWHQWRQYHARSERYPQKHQIPSIHNSLGLTLTRWKHSGDFQKVVQRDSNLSITFNRSSLTPLRPTVDFFLSTIILLLICFNFV